MIELSDSDEKQAQSIHKSCVVIDAHSDIMLDVIRRRLNGEHAVINRIHYPRMQQGGVDAYFAVVGGDFPGGVKTLEEVVRNIDWMHQEVEESQGHLVLAQTEKDIRKALEKRQIAAFLTMEGYPGISRSLSLLRTLYRLGVRSSAFPIYRGSPLSDDASYPYPEDDSVPYGAGIGLNICEREALTEMENLGMLPDISHVNPTTKNEILHRTKGPVIASHIGVKSVYDMAWNLTDRQIEAVAAKEGVIGIACLPFFLKKQATVNDFVDHVEYVQKLVGIDYVGIGADFIDYEPGYANIEFTKDLEDTTKVYNVTRAMVGRGFTRQEIIKVLGENFLQVISKVCG